MRKRARDCVDFVASAGILFGNCGSRTVAELLLLAESWTSYGRRRGSNSEKWRRPAEQQYDAMRTSILGVPSPRLHCVSLVLLDLEIYARLYVRKLWREFTKEITLCDSDETFTPSRDAAASEFRDQDGGSQDFHRLCAKEKKTL
ncbi:unnamed protein product [Calypogeia fissa]